MARIINNAYLTGIRGKFGKIGVYRNVRGRDFMTAVPRPKKTWSSRQSDMHEKFARASQYAKTMMQIEEMKALYSTGINNRKFTAYMVAFTDFLKPPEIRSINVAAYTGAVGDVIVVQATDDFKVKSVRVTLLDPDGIQIEKGVASLPPHAFDTWEYVTTTSRRDIAGVKIIAVAQDLAGIPLHQKS